VRIVLVLSALALASAGCVATAEVRPTRAEARARPPAEQGRPPSALSMLAHVSATRAGENAEPPAGGAPDRVLVRGYWHWTGSRYVWVPGRWEPRAPRYTWHRR
jgi:hypothetical protein